MHYRERDKRKRRNVLKMSRFLPKKGRKSGKVAQVFMSAFLVSCGWVMTLGVGTLNAARNETVSESPYGMCAHLAGGQEYEAMPRNLELMQEIGVEWVRFDFSWWGIEGPRGNWHFEHLDRVVKLAEAEGIKILPILNHPAGWGCPVYENPEPWLEYVRQTVTHFQDKIRYWEVWNESNLHGFGHGDESTERYAELLRKTYEVIKSIDPDLQVVYGGLSGAPAEYYEKTLQAGAGEFFDVVNIHPYRGGMVSPVAVERFLNELRTFQELTVKYCGKEKPLWITEMGWATPPELGRNARCLIGASLARLFPDGIPRCNVTGNGDAGGKAGKIGVLADTAYVPANGLSTEFWENVLPSGMEAQVLRMTDLLELDPEKTPILIMPPGEHFPSSCAVELQKYVKEGGTLILLGGVPFYYQHVRREDGLWTQVPGNPYGGKLDHDFRVDWTAWWLKEGVPKQVKLVLAPNVKNDEKAAAAMKDYPLEKLDGSRFFTDKMLKPGDVMEPILVPEAVMGEDAEVAENAENSGTETVKNAEKAGFNLPSACIYRFNSDWKGNIVVSAILGDMLGNTNLCLADEQGVYLSQAILLALSHGVEKFFNYEFQASGTNPAEPECHFGIVNMDLTPKSGYVAYQSLTKARPAGSVSELVSIPEKTEKDEPCIVSWKRPDGQIGYAIWMPSGKVTKKVRISGKITDAFTCYGKKVEFSGKDVSEEMAFSEEVTYFVGEDLEIHVANFE
ncbi:MAG: beta-galactosidase [Planctomycetia bacterium]|nr:beta-galactosidase [Planctomycetia bacterium]